MIRIVAVTIGLCIPDNSPNIPDLDGELVLVGHTTDDQAAPELCAAMRPDIALVDMCDSGADGFRTVQAIRAKNAHIKILVVSRSDDPEYARAMLKVGVAGYLHRPEDLGDLDQSIRTVYSGRVVCSSSIAQALLHSSLKR